MVDAIAAGAPIDQLARYFEYWLLRLQGVYPAFGCRAPLLGDAGARWARDAAARARLRLPACAPAGGGTELSAMAMQFLARRRFDAPEAGPLRCRTAASRELETAHRRLHHLHLEKELKSARVLREMRHTR